MTQELGDTAEDAFSTLAEMLGYKIRRKRQPEPGIDLVADFSGKPPNLQTPCSLIKPAFSPEGVTAFSVKRGNFTPADVAALSNDINEAHASQDELLRSIQGGVMVCNFVKTEGELDSLLGQGVHCWDLRRLIFYSVKARLVTKLASEGPIEEKALSGDIVGSFFVSPIGNLDKHTLLVKVVILVDDHHSFLGYDHVLSALRQAYETGLRGMSETTGYYIQANISLHVLGLANPGIADQAFRDYAGNSEEHEKVTFSAASGLELFQYGAAPWFPMLTV